MRKSSFLTTIFFFSLPTSLLAQPAEERIRFHLLLSSEEGAPSPADIVENWDFSSPPPTPGFEFQMPEAVWYFLPFRARGNFLQRLEANPDTPRARLERYIVVEYTPDADLKAITAALEDDSNIEAVAEPVAFEWSAINLKEILAPSSYSK
jgi:hypothetical protein